MGGTKKVGVHVLWEITMDYVCTACVFWKVRREAEIICLCMCLLTTLLSCTSGFMVSCTTNQVACRRINAVIRFQWMIFLRHRILLRMEGKERWKERKIYSSYPGFLLSFTGCECIHSMTSCCFIGRSIVLLSFLSVRSHQSTLCLSLNGSPTVWSGCIFK